jgi:hypothetical protein
VVVDPAPFDQLRADEREALVVAAERYGRFLGRPAKVVSTAASPTSAAIR